MGSREPSPVLGGQRPPPIDSSTPPTQARDGHAHAAASVLPPPASHVTDDAPPYWTSRPGRHSRSTSYHSLNQTRPPAILLEDNTDDRHDHSQSCWAQSVSIDEYVVVSGPTGIGAYVVWHCTVSTLKGGDLCIRKRSPAARHRATPPVRSLSCNQPS